MISSDVGHGSPCRSLVVTVKCVNSLCGGCLDVVTAASGLPGCARCEDLPVSEERGTSPLSYVATSSPKDMDNPRTSTPVEAKEALLGAIAKSEKLKTVSVRNFLKLRGGIQQKVDLTYSFNTMHHIEKFVYFFEIASLEDIAFFTSFLEDML